MLSILALKGKLTSVVNSSSKCVLSIIKFRRKTSNYYYNLHRHLTSSTHQSSNSTLSVRREIQGGLNRAKLICQVISPKICSRNKSSSTSTRLPPEVREDDEDEEGDKEFKGRQSTEDIAIELLKCSDEVEVLEYLQKIGTKKLEKRALATTTKILYYRLKRAESQSVHRTILHCIEKLYDPTTGKSHIKNLDSKTLLRLTEILVTLQCPPDYSVLEETLHFISENLIKNRGKALTLHQIVQLEYLLQQLPHSAQTRALHATLPMSFEQRLDSQLDSDDLEMLVNDIHDIDWEVLLLDEDNVVQAAVNDVIQQRIPLNLYKAFNFLLFVADCCDVKLIRRSEELIPILFKTLGDGVSVLNDKEIALLLTTCADKCLEGDYVYYDEQFVQALASKALEGKDYLDIGIINSISAMGHVSEELLDTVSQIVSKDPGMLKDPEILVAFVHLFATTGHPPKCWEMNFNIETEILEHAAKSTSEPHVNLALVLDLLALDYDTKGRCFLDVLEKVFSPKNMHVHTYEECGFEAPTLTTPLRYGATPLLLAIGAIRHLHPTSECQKRLPPVDVIKRLEAAANEQSNNWRYPISLSLEAALGGPAYVTTGIWNQGIHIDHCILVESPEGSPVELSQHQFTLNDAINQFPILVKVHPNMHYLANVRRLRGIYELEAKVLRKFGHPLIEIDMSMWKKLEAKGLQVAWITQKIQECIKSNTTKV